MSPQDSNSWGVYSKLVLQKLEDHENLLKDINEVLIQIRVDLSVLNVKSGVWGLLAGAIPVAILLIVNYMKSG